MTNMVWGCQLDKDNNTINVKLNGKLIGMYRLTQRPFCPKCASPLHPDLSAPQKGVCRFCQHLNYLDKVRSIGLYFKQRYRSQLSYIKKPDSDNLSGHILRLKGDRRCANPLGEAMVCLNNVYPELSKPDVVIPIPLDNSAFSKRGYNQAQEIAKVFCKKTNLLLDSESLTKIKQVNMRNKSLPERVKAVDGVYKVEGSFEGKSILLIDDILTTGATANECAKVLKEAYAEEVNIYVAGRTAPEY